MAAIQPILLTNIFIGYLDSFDRRGGWVHCQMRVNRQPDPFRDQPETTTDLERFRCQTTEDICLGSYSHVVLFHILCKFTHRGLRFCGYL